MLLHPFLINKRMKNVQPSVEAQKKLCDIDDDVHLPFTIPGTTDVCKIGFLKNYTCNMITRLLVTRKVSKPKSDSTKDVIETMSEHPVPTVKISSNSRLYANKKNWIDFNCGELVEGVSLDTLSNDLFEYVLSVASGKKVKSEEAGFHDMAIFKQGVTL